MIRLFCVSVCRKRLSFTHTRCHRVLAIESVERNEDTQETLAIQNPVNEITGQLTKSQPSERYLKFKEKLRSDAPLISLPKGMPHPAEEKEPLQAWPNNTNPFTGEIGGPRGPEPTRYGDWEHKGRVTDF